MRCTSATKRLLPKLARLPFSSIEHSAGHWLSCFDEMKQQASFTFDSRVINVQ